MFVTGSAAGHTALRDALRDFLCDQGSAWGLEYSGTGNGTLDAYTGGADSVFETFTIQATSATNFTVTGSVTGALPAATVGTPYAEGEIAFEITAGGTAFVAGDTFTLSTAPPWVAELDASPELILRAPGYLDESSNEVNHWVGIRSFQDAPTDYYNWELAGYDGYNSGLGWGSQANTHRSLYVPLWQNAIPYWFVANGRRAIMVAKVSTVYVAAYLGFLEPYLDPTVYPYPLALGGTMAFTSDPATNSANWRWSNTALTNSVFPIADPNVGGSSWASREVQMRVRRNSGTWRGFQARGSGSAPSTGSTVAAIAPYCGSMTGMKAGPGGQYPLWPVELFDDEPGNPWGRLDGIFATTGFGLGAETVHTRGVLDYIIFPNVYRTQSNNFFAVRLD